MRAGCGSVWTFSPASLLVDPTGARGEIWPAVGLVNGAFIVKVICGLVENWIESQRNEGETVR